MTAGTSVGVVVLLTGFGLPGKDASVVVDDLSQLAAGVVAVCCCLWTTRGRTGPDRIWRILMAAGIGGWTAGQSLWTWYRLVDRTPIPSPSLADLGYFILPLFALPALLVLGSDRHRDVPRAIDVRRLGSSRLVLFLDGLIVVGSLFIVTWSTALGGAVHAGAPTPAAFVVAVGYPITDLVLAVIVVLLIADRQVRLQPQLRLLGLGLVALAMSDSAFTYLVSMKAPEIPPLADVGFIAAPVLVALAALAPKPAGAGFADASTAGASRFAEWGHLLMPYVPLLVMGTLVITQTAIAGMNDPVEITVGLAVFVVVVARQMITIIDNTRLLSRLRESQGELEHQAFHDPLTGLANRTLFHERLTYAIELADEDGTAFGLLFVDLDDFKEVNDQHGHAGGDALLELVARRLRVAVRETDVVARLGGDEFGVLVPGVGEPERIALRILEQLREPALIGDQRYVIRASIGVVVRAAPDPGLTADDLLHRADTAMYDVKRRGKGGMVVYQTADLVSPDP